MPGMSVICAVRWVTSGGSCALEMWLSVAEELTAEFYLILMNLVLNSPTELMVITLESRVEHG